MGQNEAIKTTVIYFTADSVYRATLINFPKNSRRKGSDKKTEVWV